MEKDVNYPKIIPVTPFYMEHWTAMVTQYIEAELLTNSAVSDQGPQSLWSDQGPKYLQFYIAITITREIYFFIVLMKLCKATS